MNTIVIGIDSETCKGEPITIQFYSDAEPAFNECLFVDGNNATSSLFRHLSKHCKPGGYYRIYGHNLKFDAVSFFWSRYEELADIEGFEFTVGDWEIRGFYGTPTFITAMKDKIRVEFVDSYLWFATSLANAAQMHFPDIPKLPMPEGLGLVKFKRKDKDFVAYAMQDSIIACKLGQIIEDMHREFHVRPQISLAGMSSAVFLTHFLHHDIVAVPKDYVHGAVCAYHGGKNNVISKASPAWHQDISSYDLSSAYPYAMTFMPGFSNAENYRIVKYKKMPRDVPADGVYLISGYVKYCEWPSLFHHNFEPIKGENIADTWVNGYDLNAALSTGEVRLKSCEGIYYDAPDSEDRPLKRYAEFFYKAKENATDPVERFRNKIVLNSLYGKFIQTKEMYVEENGEIVKTRVASGLFQPMIAGGITSHTRAVMHYLEHELDAIHTATDGIYTYNKPNRLKLPRKGLGSLQFEGRGDLALVRSKLYILYADDGKIPSIHFQGKMIKKYARHGFMGTLGDLERYLAFGRRRYTVNKPNTLKESIKRGLIPNEFNERPFVLRAGDMKVYGKKA